MKKVAWFIPEVTKGSGGHRTIIQHVNLLEENGYKCDLYVRYFTDYTEEEVEEQINQFYMDCKAKVHKGWYTNKKYDIAFATSWDSIRYVKEIDVDEKFYFIQDFEPWFFPMSDKYLLAESTYKEDFKAITIGKWLSYKLNNEFNMKTGYFNFCADLNIYKKQKRKKENAICAIFQPNKPRRCINLLISALKIVNKTNPNIKIYLYGSEKQNIKGLKAEHLGIITPKELNELYNKCKLGVSMSSSNPSRIPFEMMASGLPVVELYRENNLYDMPDNAVLLAGNTPEDIASAILNLYEDEKRLKKMSINASKYMKEYPLEKGYDEFISLFNSYIDGTKKESRINKIYNKEEHKNNKELVLPENYINDLEISVEDNIKQKLENKLNEKEKELYELKNCSRWKMINKIMLPIDKVMNIKHKNK